MFRCVCARVLGRGYDVCMLCARTLASASGCASTMCLDCLSRVLAVACRVLKNLDVQSDAPRLRSTHALAPWPFYDSRRYSLHSVCALALAARPHASGTDAASQETPVLYGASKHLLERTVYLLTTLCTDYCLSSMSRFLKLNFKFDAPAGPRRKGGQPAEMASEKE